MKFTERREFLYDPDVFSRGDTRMALRLHNEYVVKHAGKPYPRFHEVDRSVAAIDPLWHQPIGDRVAFTRVLEVPAIVTFEKLNWALMRMGRIPQQKVRLMTSNLVLQGLDYFPLQGDVVYWNGNRLEITSVEFEPNAYWQQTNVWLGIVYIAQIVPEGDSKPAAIPSQLANTEISPQAEQPFITLPDKTKLPGTGIPSADYAKPLLGPTR